MAGPLDGHRRLLLSLVLATALIGGCSTQPPSPTSSPPVIHTVGIVAVFAHQDGLPEDCHIPGIGAVGIERGSFIEIKGVLWRKAAAFRSAQPLPALGEQFDASTRFCFDDQAEVTTTVS